MLTMLPNAAAASSTAPVAEAPSLRLMLDVELNGERIGLLGDFRLTADHELVTTIDELLSLGIDARRIAPAGSYIALDRIPGLQYRYDESEQSVVITCPPALLRETVISTYDNSTPGQLSSTATGVVLNYAVVATSRLAPYTGFDITGQLDGRIFGKFGLISGSAIATMVAGQPSRFIRLDTAWTIENPARMTAWRVGDSVNSGLSWTRPIRFTGIQYGRRFDVRPDLITAPLPVFRGTAALPSSVDLYVDNQRSFSSQIPAGPFALRYTPGTLGSLPSRLVVTDAIGRQSSVDLSFYATDALLAPKLSDFSIEAGFARRNFGVYSNDYNSRPVGSATLRYGLTRMITLQGHVEATSGLVNVGAGGVFNLFDLAIGTLSVAYSSDFGRAGQYIEIGLEARRGPFSFTARATRTFGQYRDLASATATTASRAFANQFVLPRATEQAQLSTRLWTRDALASISYMRISGSAWKTRLVTVSLTQRVGVATLSLRGSQDFEDHRRRTLSFGISMPFGGRNYGSAEAISNEDRLALLAEASSRPASEPGDFAWRATAATGAINEQGAAVSYMSRMGRAEVGVRRSDARIGVFAQAEGSIAFIDSQVFATRRIDDSFAVVNVGVKGVPVSIENRKVGRTSASGRMLVPQLIAYNPNRIAIDATALPVDRDLAVDNFIVTPRRGVGIILKIENPTSTDGALVTFVDWQGTPLAVGSIGTRMPSKENFAIGYDGAAYIERLSAVNTVQVEDPTGRTCTAEFAFKPQSGQQVHLGPIKCLSIAMARR